MKNSNKNADGTVDDLSTGEDRTNNAGATIDYIRLNNNAANVMMTLLTGLLLKDISHTVLNIKQVMTGLPKLSMNSLLTIEWKEDLILMKMPYIEFTQLLKLNNA